MQRRFAFVLALATLAACSRGSSSAQGASGGQASSATTAAKAVQAGSAPSSTCDACETRQCPERKKYCEAFTGDKRAACERLVECVRRTNCHSNDNTLDCYCGKADATECLTPGGAKGACIAEIEAAQGTSDPQVIQANYTEPKFPGGAALAYMLCDAIVCKADCVPYFRSR